jgi:uncharacterized membrane protein
MLANIWHWWIGVVLAVVAIGACIGLVVGYLRNVVAPQHPGKNNPEE